MCYASINRPKHEITITANYLYVQRTEMTRDVEDLDFNRYFNYVSDNNDHFYKFKLWR